MARRWPRKRRINGAEGAPDAVALQTREVGHAAIFQQGADDIEPGAIEADDHYALRLRVRGRHVRRHYTLSQQSAMRITEY